MVRFVRFRSVLTGVETYCRDDFGKSQREEAQFSRAFVLRLGNVNLRGGGAPLRNAEAPNALGF